MWKYLSNSPSLSLSLSPSLPPSLSLCALITVPLTLLCLSVVLRAQMGEQLRLRFSQQLVECRAVPQSDITLEWGLQGKSCMLNLSEFESNSSGIFSKGDLSLYLMASSWPTWQKVQRDCHFSLHSSALIFCGAGKLMGTIWNNGISNHCDNSDSWELRLLDSPDSRDSVERVCTPHLQWARRCTPGCTLSPSILPGPASDKKPLFKPIWPISCPTPATSNENLGTKHRKRR